MENNNHSTISYVVGYVLSILLTLAAYLVVQIHVSSEHSVISHAVLIPTILALAVIQLIVQLIFFLHLNAKEGGRSQLGIFLATIGLVLIIVIGSIWIMDHLNYNMTPAQVDQYMQQQQGGF